MDELELGRRAGLPDALRILVEKHPRPGWEGHPEFNALTRFWLERHLMFRRLQAMLLAETETRLDGGEARAFGGRLSQLGGMFINELHGHHHVEDEHYFPLLVRAEPRLEAGFALLDRDHRSIDPLLHGLAERTNAVLRAIGHGVAGAEVGRLHGELERFGGFLDRHLTDEEELVVPVILEHAGAGLG